VAQDPNEAMVGSVVTTANTGNYYESPPGLGSAPIADANAPQARYATNQEFFSLSAVIVTEEVYVPAIKRTLIVSALTAEEMQLAREDCKERRNGREIPRLDRDLPTMVVFYATRNPDGTRFFHRNQVDQLNRKTSYAAIQPLAKVALRLSGLDDDAEDLERKRAFEGNE